MVSTKSLRWSTSRSPNNWDTSSTRNADATTVASTAPDADRFLSTLQSLSAAARSGLYRAVSGSGSTGNRDDRNESERFRTAGTTPSPRAAGHRTRAHASEARSRSSSGNSSTASSNFFRDKRLDPLKASPRAAATRSANSASLAPLPTICFAKATISDASLSLEPSKTRANRCFASPRRAIFTAFANSDFDIKPSLSLSQALTTTSASDFGRPPSNSPSTQLANKSELSRGSSVDRSNSDRGFCSFREASTVHSRANAATSAVSAASFCFFLDDRRLNGRIDAVRASCIAWLSEDGGMTS
mmetsp:Transcript_2220/g.6186  ORF Transcript_2220/g.6186 Transcript_2220/m.6186 type:complete len:301 (-) Transcript_2220:202-1104(-)